MAWTTPTRRLEALCGLSVLVSFEVHVDRSIATLTRRDLEGLYRKALAGEIARFSGVSDPYEQPAHSEIYLNSEV